MRMKLNRLSVLENIVSTRRGPEKDPQLVISATDEGNWYVSCGREWGQILTPEELERIRGNYTRVLKIVVELPESDELPTEEELLGESKDTQNAQG